MPLDFQHTSVLLHEAVDALSVRPDGVYVDGTAGGAGHSLEIARRLDGERGGRLFALDRDPDAVAAASERLAGYPATVLQRNYDEIPGVLAEFSLRAADGILMDLGVSSHQLDTESRGFSYHTDAPLDMRMSREGLSARDVVNTYSEEALTKILFEFGEEKFARRISANILAARKKGPVETTGELAAIIKASVPAAVRREKNPCKRTFQAIRMEVNGELAHLSEGLDRAFESLRPGGRLAVITFHSLEDRLVKRRFRHYCQGCTCPPAFPQCVCGKTPDGRLLFRKPVEPSEEERAANNRSRSARLRVVERMVKADGEIQSGI